MGPSIFANLPFELLERIIRQQEPARIAVSREVCKTLKTVVDNSPAMVYTITLAKYGLKENPAALPVSAAERLGLLNAQVNSSWVEMQPGEDTEELITPSFRLWEFFGNVFAHVIDNNIIFNQFASPRTNRPRLTWEVPLRMRGALGDFGMDPSQDLLILARSDVSPPVLTLAFRTMSTGHGHPMAKLTELTIPTQAIDASLGLSYHISVCGTFACILLNDGDDGNGFGLFIIDWKTGELCMDLRRSDGYDLVSFAFVSETQIAVCAVEREEEEDVVQGIRIYNFLSGQRIVSVADRDCVDLFLELPGNFRAVYDCTIRSDPTPAWPGPGDTFTQFYDHPDELIYTIFVRSLGEHDDVTLVVRRASLLEHLGRGVRDIPWSDWGERGASCVDIIDGDSYWTCRTFGSLMVAANIDTEALTINIDTEALTIYDFNQKRARLFPESLTSRSESTGKGEGTRLTLVPFDDKGEHVGVLEGKDEGKEKGQDATEDEFDWETESENITNDSFDCIASLPFRKRVFPNILSEGRQDAMIGLDCILIIDDEAQFCVLSL
ncbi:hypothetical protein CYLTODRAFT_419533 [Cylindrobasidium torrendii FP15055 ss-10]|uniref:F-box domain-containing protein n=1 Tax=Cylindrobasidium torrendii FP15055 ss-10 TaxID=1314674 RepID=A0A0D7BKI6_9AGAR|nr:hypothetical protein CYLTODRAFT_419533 [Cylindrobasidium torrendii FP15055 ss-10]